MSNENKFEHITIEKEEKGNFAVISINRPEKLNALHIQTLKEITEALETVEVDQSVRCVVLRGIREYTKKPAFSAGADLSDRRSADLDPTSLRHQSHAMYRRHKYYNLIEEFPKPIIAAIDGYALGGGFELVLVCDISIASKRSIFGFPEIQRGIFPANGGTQRLVRNVGKMRAKRMLFFGEHYSAEQMFEWGVISYVVDDDEFENFVHKKASWLGNAATNSLFLIKKSIDYGTQTPLNIGLQFEQMGYAINTRSEDVAEGVSAFLEKRTPKFQGK
ncbi:MAG: enoyl-CoA hydratase/isomerase family protein [Candidatus Heimdallarchaeota archaeon]|nr:MAG: enoyl-CoA hydratase/isomerase family protein [Candidatus Heimdallarchaeota archaeon]